MNLLFSLLLLIQPSESFETSYFTDKVGTIEVKAFVQINGSEVSIAVETLSGVTWLRDNLDMSNPIIRQGFTWYRSRSSDASVTFDENQEYIGIQTKETTYFLSKEKRDFF